MMMRLERDQIIRYFYDVRLITDHLVLDFRSLDLCVCDVANLSLSLAFLQSD